MAPPVQVLHRPLLCRLPAVPVVLLEAKPLFNDPDMHIDVFSSAVLLLRLVSTKW